jgi:hypothetical protein
MKTIFVLVDALKTLYLTEDNMPFLFSLSQKSLYIKEILPCAGFCERSEIFSGLDGYDTGNFTAIGYIPEESPYKNDKTILTCFGLLKKVSPRLYYRLISSWRYRNKKILNNYRIPPESLIHFALTEDGRKQLIAHNDLFQVLDANGMNYTLDGFTSLSDLGKRSHLTIKEIAEREVKKGTDFIPLYIGETDSDGHRYGGDIDKMKPTLKSVDQTLEEIYKIAASAGYSFCVMGDHGMVPVTKKLDVATEIDKADCKLHKDYEVFYDSTMARFWFFNEKAETAISHVLKVKFTDYGFLVDKSNYFQYRIPMDILSEDGKPVYGDLIWCANPGVLISPDYFHSESDSENGMHGYIEVVRGHGTGLFVEMHPGVSQIMIESAHSSQICEELCKSLGIDQPNSKEWKRVV